MSYATEVNFEGIIGPTHHYGGLSYGNIPSKINRHSKSNPKKAALEGLNKMKTLHDLGVKQAVLPPHARPCMEAMWYSGYKGTEKKILETIAKKDPELLTLYSSASSMWTANAATISPSSDTADQRVHITAANLISQKHRSIEAFQTYKFLKYIFKDEKHFSCHLPLENAEHLGDEGAANHMRVTPAHHFPGIEIFVYGKDTNPDTIKPEKFPARHNLESSQINAKNHKLNEKHTIFIQQNPLAIDNGIFHNDLISTANENCVLMHEHAFVDAEEFINELEDKYYNLTEKDVHILVVGDDQLSIAQSAKSFFFNSQIVTVNEDEMALISPIECTEKPIIELINTIMENDNPIKYHHFVDLNGSMKNGGGPACLRLRIVLTEKELAAIHTDCLFSNELYTVLKDWINKHYREELTINDFQDFQLLKESRCALDELSKILNLGNIYSFQKG